MTDDVRISVGLPNHPKTKKLKRRIGSDGCWSLIVLFLWVGSERWDGNLAGMTDEDIELAAGWDGSADAFVTALVEVGFLRGEAGERFVYAWQEHNPYAAAKGSRIAKGKSGAAARWGKGANAPSIPNDAPSIGQAMPDLASNDIEQCPPAPAPAPAPTKPEASVANATGADAPQADPIWHTGLAFLKTKGIPEPQARQFLGKLKREAGDIDAAALLARCETEDITDPVPWLSKAAVLARERRKTGQGSQPASKTLNAIHALEGMKNGLAQNRISDRIPEVALLEFGSDASDGPDPRNGRRVA